MEICNIKIIGWSKFGESMSIRQIFLVPKFPPSSSPKRDYESFEFLRIILAVVDW